MELFADCESVRCLPTRPTPTLQWWPTAEAAVVGIPARDARPGPVVYGMRPGTTSVGILFAVRSHSLWRCLIEEARF